MEQGAWSKIRKGAGSMENVIWEQGAQSFRKGSREQAPKNGREQGEQGEMTKEAGSIDPPLTEPQ